MSQKRPVPLPTNSRKIARGAVILALAALQDERVREQLSKAPAAVRTWAASRRSGDRASESRLHNLDPTQRFGHRGLERRRAALQRNADVVFDDPLDPSGAAIHRALDELEQAIAISATMPLTERRRARARIGAELTRLEVALVEAVLPATD